jgi:hypothetical protein
MGQGAFQGAYLGRVTSPLGRPCSFCPLLPSVQRALEQKKAEGAEKILDRYDGLGASYLGAAGTMTCRDGFACEGRGWLCSRRVLESGSKSVTGGWRPALGRRRTGNTGENPGRPRRCNRAQGSAPLTSHCPAGSRNQRTRRPGSLQLGSQKTYLCTAPVDSRGTSCRTRAACAAGKP